MQPLPRLNDGEFEKLAGHIQQLLETLETLPYPKVQADVFELLNSIDHLHREALTRLVELIEEKASGIKREMADDYAIQTLMMLYNFVPVEEMPTAVQETAAPVMIGLDQINVKPLEEVRRPVWIPALRREEIPCGGVIAREVEGVRLLLWRTADDNLFAYDNACLQTPLPLDQGTVEDDLLTCPWHGCRYNLRTGEIQNSSGMKLASYPLMESDDGRLRVGFNIPPWMR